MNAALVIATLLLIGSNPAIADEAGRIRGLVVTSEQPIPDASIRAMPQGTGRTKYRERAKGTAVFKS